MRADLERLIVSQRCKPRRWLAQYHSPTDREAASNNTLRAGSYGAAAPSGPRASWALFGLDLL